ncbi:right-handed parallel beta-helix repeat-containing protein [Neobacillus jeddahensis]|uniref:right-handed parallel beta-helix repeat-containing protein n=1 Tax=Neobacillus jeddahensis TaxID=1461580 RepID=UPI00058E4C23|nr:right-handed parallel beta-helix repeat-containing protein [Neobacillus jeddahensis]
MKSFTFTEKLVLLGFWGYMGFISLQLIYTNIEGMITKDPKWINQTNLTVNVKVYGAKGDGRTEDTAAFQKAIDEVNSNGGGEVFVPPGNYILQPIFVKSNVSLVGENRDTVTLKLSDAANDQKQTRLVNINNVKNVQLKNITFDGNYKKHTNGIEHMHTVFVWDSDQVIITHNRMRNAVGDGISLTGSTRASNYITVSHNIIKDNHRSNIVVEQVNHIKIFNNISTSKVGRPTLHFEPWEKVNLYDAKIYNNTFKTNASETYTIQIEGTKGAGNFYNKIEFYNNTVKGKKGKFMIKETKGTKIHDNQFDVKNMYIWFKNEDLQIFRNKIKSDIGFVIDGYLGNSRRTVISDNSVSTSGDGINILTGSQDTKFKRNTFIGPGDGRGAYLWANETNIMNTNLIGNSFLNYSKGVITESYSGNIVDGLNIEKNTFKNIAGYSVYTTRKSSKNVTVRDNDFINTSGIHVQN